MANKEKLIDSAQKYLAKGQLSKAVGEYQKLVDAFPKDFRLRQKLAELLCRDKRSEDAQPHYEAVAKNFTDTGFYLKAIAIYKQMQKLEPVRADIYLRLAELNEKQGLIGNALNECRALLTIHEKNHKIKEAIAVLRKMQALDPENIAMRARLIEALIADDEEAEALEQYCALDRLLNEQADQAAIARLHERFASLHSRQDDISVKSAAPAGEKPAPAAAESASREREQTVSAAVESESPAAAVAGDATPAAPVAATAGEPPLEIDLEIDFADAGEGTLSAASAAEELPDVALPDELELPDFCDLGSDLEEIAAPLDEALPDAEPAVPEAVEEAEVLPAVEDFEVAEVLPETVEEAEPVEEAVPVEDLGEPLEELEELVAVEEVVGDGAAAEQMLVAEPAAFVVADVWEADGDDREGEAAFDEDAQSHFDLGIAYKEMGLLEEALGEFGKAAHDPSRRLDCLTLQGQCRMSLGQFAEAEAIFKDALTSPGLSDEVRIALRYELGLLYESANRLLEALECYDYVAGRDQFFRDVATKQKSLRGQLGLDDQTADAGGGRASRDRISYL